MSETTPIVRTQIRKPLSGKGPRKTVLKQPVPPHPPHAEPVTPLENLLDTPIVDTTVTPGGTRHRREISVSTVDTSFVELCAIIEAEIAKQRSVKTPGTGGLKFLRSALKKIRQLQNDVRRVSRKKRALRNGTNSGFLKPTAINDALADFLQVQHGTELSRVECTKRLHQYILENGLQNPDNRREILPNKPLSKLLKYNKKAVDDGGHGPLFYYTMQKLIQPLFLRGISAKSD